MPQKPNYNLIDDIILDVANISDVPDEKTQQEEENHIKAIQKLQYISIRQDIGERKRYANRIFVLIVWWLIGIGVLLLIQGFGLKFNFFQLSDKIMVTLVGGTTINILGIFIVVVNYLFPKFPYK